MFRNYLAAALRNLVRNRLYAAINIIGLAVGFAAALVIGLFVRDEFSYDRWLPDSGHTYILTTTNSSPGQSATASFEGPPEVMAWLKRDFPAIEAVARIYREQVGIRRGEIEAMEPVLWADRDLFSILQVPVVAGDLSRALAQPDTVVLSRRMAQKYFGRDNPVGEPIEVSRSHAMRVAAVIEDLPSNTHLALDIVLSGGASFSRLSETDAQPPASARGGVSTSVLTYIRLAPGTSPETMNAALPPFVRRHMPLTVENGRHLQLSVMPVTAIHLAPAAMAGPMKAGADLAAVYALIGVGCLIVLAASMNFVNLMTARAARRAVEVGVRRVSGAWHRNLVLQFMGESLIYVMFGMVAALALTAAVLPGFNAFLSRTIGFDYGRDPALMAATAGLVLLIGALAGFYPAVVLARIRPAAVLKGKAQKAGSGIVRQSLVVIQFAILIGLILATGVIYRQTAYALGNGLRLDKDQVLLVHGPCARAFKEEVARLPGVRAVSCARSAPLNFESSSGPALLPTGMETTVAHTSIDFGFFELYGLRPLAGRFFASDRVADVVPADRTGPWQAPLVINEAAMRKFGFATPDAAIGKTVVLTGAGGTRAQTSEIIGVVPDFPVDSIRQPIEETVYYVDPARFGLMSVKLRGEQIPETLRAIDRLWDQVGGRSAPIRREFLDQYQQRLYVDITREADLFAVFAGTAVFIAALGLFGLAVFTAEQRVKEIGIRKALGASRGDVLRLLLWQFAKPVLWANLIAWPAGYVAMNHWLEGFAYHIDPEPSVFIGASAIALAIAIATILGQALQVARAQPVASLRYE